MIGKPSSPVRREAARKRTSPGWHLAARPTQRPGSPATAAAPATTNYPDVGVTRIIRRPWLSRADAVLHGVGTFWTRVARDNSALLPRHDRWAPVCRW